MARKTLTITIDAEGRDKGKTFLLTEMPASKGEKWAVRALLALARGGIEVPENIAGLGLAGIAIIGVQALSGLEWELAEPLMDEMFACIQIIPDATRPQVVRGLVEGTGSDDIEEVKTRIMLRKEILALHVEFFMDAALLKQARDMVAAALPS